MFEKFDQKFNMKKIDYIVTFQLLYIIALKLIKLFQLFISTQRQNYINYFNYNKNFLSN